MLFYYSSVLFIFPKYYFCLSGAKCHYNSISSIKACIFFYLGVGEGDCIIFVPGAFINALEPYGLLL